MNEQLDLLFPKKLYNTPYKDYNEYLRDNLNQCEILLMYYKSYIKEKSTGDIKTSNMLKEKALSNFRYSCMYIKSRIECSDNKNYVFSYVFKESYCLSELEWFSIILSLMMEIKSYRDIVSSCEVLNQNQELTYDSIMKVFYISDDVYNISDYNSIYKIFTEKMISLVFGKHDLKIDPVVFSIIMFNRLDKPDIEGITIYGECRNEEILESREITAKKIADFFISSDYQESIYYYINGCTGCGRKTLIRRVSELMKSEIVFIDLQSINVGDEKELYNFVVKGCRHALLRRASICIENFNIVTSKKDLDRKHIKFILNTVKRYSKVVFIISTDLHVLEDYKSGKIWINISLKELTKEESIAIWSECLKGKDITVASPEEMANKFTFTPKQIKGTIEQAEIAYVWGGKKLLSVKQFCECAYTQVVHNLDKKATVIHTKHNWNQLIMDPKEKNMIRDACDQIIYKHIVYEKWGMKKRLMYGRGVSMLFAGPPGTGKTMAAQVVANELGLEIYKINLSRVVSKYIGETEKNLESLFEEAKKSNVILFFDETDALLGKRTEVKDSHDKNANFETSYLLQKMEEYDGITIMTTNYLQNIDKAFFRRISYVIHFVFPGPESRKQIWKTMYPKEMPLSSDIDFDYLANIFEISGGSIKNIVVSSAFMAARENKKVQMKHIVKAAKYELAKQGKMMMKQDFGEYGYLLDI